MPVIDGCEASVMETDIKKCKKAGMDYIPTKHINEIDRAIQAVNSSKDSFNLSKCNIKNTNSNYPYIIYLASILVKGHSVGF